MKEFSRLANIQSLCIHQLLVRRFQITLSEHRAAFEHIADDNRSPKTRAGSKAARKPDEVEQDESDRDRSRHEYSADDDSACEESEDDQPEEDQSENDEPPNGKPQNLNVQVIFSDSESSGSDSSDAASSDDDNEEDEFDSEEKKKAWKIITANWLEVTEIAELMPRENWPQGRHKVPGTKDWDLATLQGFARLS
jgi:hypothetical protein